MTLILTALGSSLVPSGTSQGLGLQTLLQGKAHLSHAEFLDLVAPLAGGSHCDATGYLEQNGMLVVMLEEEIWSILRKPEQFLARKGNPRAPQQIVLDVDGLNLELHFNRGDFLSEEPACRLRDIVFDSIDQTRAVALVDSVIGNRKSPRIL